MLQGIDISSWQTPGSVDLGQYSFAIIKASEGRSVTDKYHAQHYANARSKGLLTGFYHYARPEYNSAETEAAHFLNVVGPYLGKAVLALDYEGKALDYGPGWALTWLNEVYRRSGVRPVLYIQGSAVAQYGAVCQAGYPLWIAAWGASRLNTSPWEEYTLWQYRGDPLDLDVFRGHERDWLRLAGTGGGDEQAPEPAPEEPESPEPEPTPAPSPASEEVDEEGMPIPKTWPPRTIDREHCGGWPEIKLLQVLLLHHGYNVLTDGIWSAALTEKVKTFQRASGLQADGVVGKLTWIALGISPEAFNQS